MESISEMSRTDPAEQRSLSEICAADNQLLLRLARLKFGTGVPSET